MITYVVGDLFTSPARVLVNTVNTVGAMGKGIAKDFKTIYPDMFKQYQIFCEKKQFDIGQLWLYKTKHKWILNFPTKRDWKHPSKPEYVEAGLKKFVSTYAEKGITSIAFPMLGCGNGGLDWERQVRPAMEHYLKNLPIDIYIHLYRKDQFEVEHRKIEDIKQWLRNEPDSISFIEVWEDLVNVVASHRAFFTIDESKVGFTVDIINKPEESGIEIKSQGQIFHIQFEQLVDLWHHIRSSGYLINNNIPSEMEKYAPILISILEKLPYLKPVLISSDYQEMKHNPIGLQYIPETIQDDLFNARDIHEVARHE